jgi:hypothetical protein
MPVNLRKLTFVPKGLNDRSQAISLPGMSNNKIRPVGYGMIWRPGLIHCPDRTTRLTDPNHTVPTGRISFFASVPGSKLPGYDHLVPPGQTHLSP